MKGLTYLSADAIVDRYGENVGGIKSKYTNEIYTKSGKTSCKYRFFMI